MAELPLDAVYVLIGGVKVPLQKIVALPKSQTKVGRNDYTQQSSFYLLPISLFKKAGRVEADFKGGRREFGVLSWKAGEIIEHAPAFARLDAYDTPKEPDGEALLALLQREYPNHFPK